MKNTEAIKWLKAIKEKYIHGGDEWYDSKRKEAIDCAITVLGGEVKTNADRIRAMSDEELAERDIDIVLNVMAALRITNTGDPEEAVKLRLEWLKQRAKEVSENGL